MSTSGFLSVEQVNPTTIYIARSRSPAGADTKRLPLQQKQQQQQQPLLLKFRGRGRGVLPSANRAVGPIRSRTKTRTKSGLEGGLNMRLGGMFVNGGLSPTAVAVAVLGVVAPALLAWLVQPLVSARAHRGTAFESEGFFWGVGKGGYVAWCGSRLQ